MVHKHSFIVTTDLMKTTLRARILATTEGGLTSMNFFIFLEVVFPRMETEEDYVSFNSPKEKLQELVPTNYSEKVGEPPTIIY